MAKVAESMTGRSALSASTVHHQARFIICVAGRHTILANLSRGRIRAVQPVANFALPAVFASTVTIKLARTAVAAHWTVRAFAANVVIVWIDARDMRRKELTDE